MLMIFVIFWKFLKIVDFHQISKKVQKTPNLQHYIYDIHLVCTWGILYPRMGV